MILQALVVWVAAVYFGSQSSLKLCTDVINEHIKADNLSDAKVKVENYPSGISIFFSKDGEVYDYFLTVSDEMYQAGLKYGYTDLGQCLVKDEPAKFLKKSITVSQGA